MRCINGEVWISALHYGQPNLYQGLITYGMGDTQMYSMDSVLSPPELILEYVRYKKLFTLTVRIRLLEC